MKKVKKGDLVSLIDKNNNAYLIDTAQSTDHFKKVGVFNPAELIDKTYGSTFTVGNKNFYVFPASLYDKLKALKRKAQIILPKDASHIIIHCNITPGKKVLEAGIGSGSLTTVLACIVGSEGRVFSYEKRQDFIEHALNNLKQAHIQDIVTIKQKDVTEGIEEKNLDAIILDIPNPWDAVKHAWDALAPGGILCTYSPLISQVEDTYGEIHKHPFISLYTFETLQREIIVKEQGTRPSFDMLGHTGYLTFARKILPIK
jgi:tRNA (adenine57-N1/adenine58-N1)-methyltransferase catalytic subunit